MGDPFKGLEKILPVHITSENILPAVPTAHDVINRPRIFHSQLARHAGKTACSISIASRPWFDPFSKAGFDLVITRRISESVGVPVVASGGTGSLEHSADVLLEGKADAVLAASIFHFGTYTVGDVKQFLAKQNIPVRFY